MIHARPGFTLVEALVALAIAGVVVSAGYAALGAVSDADARGRETLDAPLADFNVRAALQQWLRAVPPPDSSATLTGVNGASGGVPADALLLRLEDAGMLHPGPYDVRIGVRYDPVTAQSWLTASLEPTDGHGSPAAVALIPAAGLEVRYLAVQSGRQVWLDAWASEDELPLAVRIEIVPPPRDAMQEASTAHALAYVPIVVPLVKAAP